MGLKIDSKIVRANMQRILKAGENATKPVAEGMALLNYLTDNVEPRTPHDKGQLVASAKITVTKRSGKIVGELWYLMPYAAKWHYIKVPVNWSKPGSGPFYLSSKILRFKNEILGTVQEALIKELEKAVK